MTKAYTLLLSLCLLLTLSVPCSADTYVHGDVFGAGASEQDPQVNTLTATKWCITDGSVINCTEDAPAGSGDITDVGSCTAGDCSSIGNGDISGGYIKFSEDSDTGTNYVKLKAPDTLEGDYTATLPSATGTLLLSDGSGASLTGITGSQVSNTPAGTISSTNVQDAVNELDTEKAAITSSITDGDTTHSPDGNSVYDALAGKESSTSQNFDPDRLAGDTVDDDAIDGTLIGLTKTSGAPTVDDDSNDGYYVGWVWVDKSANGKIYVAKDVTVGAAIWRSNVMTNSSGNYVFLGDGTGYDEDLVLDLNTTEDTAVFSSNTSLDTITFSGISLTAPGFTGTLTGTATGLDISNQTAGDLLTYTTQWTRLAKGSNNSFLGIDGVGNLGWYTNITVGSITNGTNPTADDPGEIAHDTTANQLILDDNVFDPRRTENVSIKTPISGDKVKFRKPQGLTLTSIGCVVDNATSAVIDIKECDANGTNCVTSLSSTKTCTTTYGTATISDSSVDAGDYLFVDVGTVTGTVGFLYVDINYSVTRE